MRLASSIHRTASGATGDGQIYMQQGFAQSIARSSAKRKCVVLTMRVRGVNRTFASAFVPLSHTALTSVTH